MSRTAIRNVSSIAGKKRPGFTLVEILVTMAIVAILAGIMFPSLVNQIRSGEASSIASTADAVRDALLQYRADVRRYPTHLNQLTTPPTSATDLCGRNVPSSYLDRWKGPYLDRQVTTLGVKAGDATVLDSLGRSPSTFAVNTSGELHIRIQDVDSAVARQIENDHDTSSDFTIGTIRWADVSGGRGILSMVVPIRGC